MNRFNTTIRQRLKLTKSNKNKRTPEDNRKYVEHQELFSKTEEPSEVRKVLVDYPNQVWSLDLVFMPKSTWKANRDYKYLVTIIDIYTKYAWVIPLKDKEMNTVVEALEKKLKGSPKPELVWVDEGSEFKQFFVDWLSKHNIKMYHTYGQHKAVVIERFNRTFKTLMKQYQDETGINTWIDLVDTVINDYNQSYHRTIKMSPYEATLPRNLDKVKLAYKDDSPTVIKKQKTAKKRAFKVGDRVRVRILKKANKFSKATDPNWSDTVYTVVVVKDDVKPTMYIVQNSKDATRIKGSLYAEDLMLSKF